MKLHYQLECRQRFRCRRIAKHKKIVPSVSERDDKLLPENGLTIKHRDNPSKLSIQDSFEGLLLCRLFIAQWGDVLCFLLLTFGKNRYLKSSFYAQLRFAYQQHFAGVMFVRMATEIHSIVNTQIAISSSSSSL